MVKATSEIGGNRQVTILLDCSRHAPRDERAHHAERDGYNHLSDLQRPLQIALLVLC